MNRLLVAKLSSNNFVWKKEEPFEQRKVRAEEIDIYFVNDDSYLAENIFYIDKDTNKGPNIGQPDIKQVNVFKTAIDVIQFMQRRMHGEQDFCVNGYSHGYVNGVCYSVKYDNRKHFSEEIF